MLLSWVWVIFPKENSLGERNVVLTTTPWPNKSCGKTPQLVLTCKCEYWRCPKHERQREGPCWPHEQKRWNIQFHQFSLHHPSGVTYIKAQKCWIQKCDAKGCACSKLHCFKSTKPNSVHTVNRRLLNTVQWFSDAQWNKMAVLWKAAGAVSEPPSWSLHFPWQQGETAARVRSPTLDHRAGTSFLTLAVTWMLSTCILKGETSFQVASRRSFGKGNNWTAIKWHSPSCTQSRCWPLVEFGFWSRHSYFENTCTESDVFLYEHVHLGVNLFNREDY